MLEHGGVDDRGQPTFLPERGDPTHDVASGLLRLVDRRERGFGSAESGRRGLEIQGCRDGQNRDGQGHPRPGGWAVRCQHQGFDDPVGRHSQAFTHDARRLVAEVTAGRGVGVLGVLDPGGVQRGDRGRRGTAWFAFLFCHG